MAEFPFFPDIPIRIFVVENHVYFHQQLLEFINWLPNLITCGSAHNGEEALTQIPALNPDLVIVDLALPDLNGIEVVRRLHLSMPDLPTILLASHQPYRIQQALAAGARGYVSKGDGLEVEVAIQKVLAGNIYISPTLRLIVDSHKRLLKFKHP